MAYQAAHDASTQAYGRIHKTPDGMFCWVGRIGRAYDLMAQSPNEMTAKAIVKMRQLASAAIDEAEKAKADYWRLCDIAGVTPKDTVIDCGCPACTTEPTFKAYDKERA